MDYSPSIGIFLGVIGMAYHNREDAPWDFSIEDFIVDGDYHELDLSSILPPAAANHLIHIGVAVKGTNPGRTLKFGPPGHREMSDSAGALIQTIDSAILISDWVKVNGDLKVEYYADSTINYLTFVVRGWIVD